MSKFWHGKASNVFWPQYRSSIDLDFELWHSIIPPVKDDCSSQISDLSSLEYEGLVSIECIPLWTLISPEYTLMSTCDSTRDYFVQFASLPGNIALKLKFVTKNATLWYLIIYSVPDEVDGMIRIHGRVIDQSIELQIPEKSLQSAELDIINSQNSNLVETKTTKSLSDVKSAISQTVMGALRLRGIKRSNPDFKKIYYAMHSLVDISLRKTNPDIITAEVIQEKVEQIWRVIE